MSVVVILTQLCYITTWLHFIILALGQKLVSYDFGLQFVYHKILMHNYVEQEIYWMCVNSQGGISCMLKPLTFLQYKWVVDFSTLYCSIIYILAGSSLLPYMMWHHLLMLWYLKVTHLWLSCHLPINYIQQIATTTQSVM